MATSERLAPLSSIPYSVTVDLQTRADRMISKMPGVNVLPRHVGVNSNDSNIGGHSQVRNSIAQARAQLRSRGSPFVRGGNEFRSSASPIHDVLGRHNILGKDFKRASIRTEAANDVNLWANPGDTTAAATAAKVKWEVHGMDRAAGSGLLPKLQDAPAPATEEDHRNHHKRKKKRHKKHKRKLKSLSKKRAKARLAKYSAMKMQRWFRANNTATGSSILLQRQIRRFLATKRVELVRQAREAGVMVAVKGTIQGKSGWYQDFDSQVYFFAVDVDGVWWEVVSEERWRTYKFERSKELENVPVLVSWSKNPEFGSGGLYYEQMMDGSHNDSPPHQWMCMEGIFSRVS